MNYNIRRISPRINYELDQLSNNSEDSKLESNAFPNIELSDESYKEESFSKEDNIKPYKMFQNIQEQNYTLEALKQITDNYQLTFAQIKEKKELTNAPLKFLKKKDLQYLIRVYRQKLNRKQKGAKTHFKNFEGQILGKRTTRSQDDLQQISSYNGIHCIQPDLIKNQNQESSLALLLLDSYHSLEKSAQNKIISAVDDLLKKDQDILNKILKKQVQLNLKFVLQLYENNEKFQLEQHFKKLHAISVIQLHIQISLTNNSFTEEGNTLSKTLLPYLNKQIDYSFLLQQDLFIMTRFLHSLVRHIVDTNSQVEKGFMIFWLTLDPQILQNLFNNDLNRKSLSQALQIIGYSEQASEIISENPSKFLWPNLLAYLKKQSQQNIIEKLKILNKIKIFIDPGQQMVLLDNIFDQRRLLVDLMLQTESISISIEDLIQCLDNLKFLQNNSILACFSKESKEWLLISRKLVNFELNDDKQIELKVLKELIQEYVADIENPVVIEDMIQISQSISKECPIYRHSNYQCAVASILASFISKKMVIAIMPTGSGKTFVQALLSKYFCLNKFKISIIEPNEMLTQQTSEKIGSIDYSLSINSITQFYQYQQQKDILIFDEYDVIFTNHHYHIFQNNVYGLWNLKEKFIFGFTATSNQALEKFVNNVINKPTILKFKSEFELIQGIAPIQMGNIISTQNLEKLYIKFYQDLIKLYDTKPIIVICDYEQKENVETFLKNKRLRFIIGINEQNLEIIKQWEYGILVIHPHEARGIDTKFATDSVVLIISNVENQLQYQQILGRSSRTRGNCEGYYYVPSNEKPNEILSKLLKQNFQSFMLLELVHKLINKKQRNNNLIEALNQASENLIVIKKLEDIQKLIDQKKYQQLIKGMNF